MSAARVTRAPGRASRSLSAAACALAGLSLALASSAPAGAGTTPSPEFGIVPQDGGLPSGRDLDRMPRAGISRMRTMLPWGLIESSPGRYDWAGTDAIVRELIKRGVQPFFFLYGTPAWAAAEDGRRCKGSACAVYPPRTSATQAAFGAFAAAAAARYGPGGSFWVAPVSTRGGAGTSAATPATLGPASGRAICIPILCTPEPPPTPPPNPPLPPPPLPTEPPCGCAVATPITTWQIWNEQNSPKYFAPKVKVERYAALLQSAAAGIRSVDPAAEIVLGGMWGPRSARKVVEPTASYLKSLYALGGGASFDAVAIHPYANNAGRAVAQVRSARRVVDRAGDVTAGIWITEVGWAGRGPSRNPYVKGLKGQARVLTRALSKFKRRTRSYGLRGVFWYSWRDKKGGEAICEWCGHAGLRTKKGRAKPAWRAFVRVARP